jgi:transposase
MTFNEYKTISTEEKENQITILIGLSKPVKPTCPSCGNDKVQFKRYINHSFRISNIEHKKAIVKCRVKQYICRNCSNVKTFTDSQLSVFYKPKTHYSYQLVSYFQTVYLETKTYRKAIERLNAEGYHMSVSMLHRLIGRKENE